MNRWILASLLLLGIHQVGQAQQRGSVPDWYVGIKGGVVFADDSDADDATLLGLELGGNFTNKWGFELEYFEDQRDLPSGFELEHSGFAFNLIQYNRVPLWNPYFLVGLGALRFETTDDSNTDVMVNVAAGGQWDLNNGGLMLRVEARYRYSPVESAQPGLLDAGEPLVTVGLSFPL